MSRYIEGIDRSQVTLFPDRLEDWIDEDNPVRVIDAFVGRLELDGLDFERATEAQKIIPNTAKKALAPISQMNSILHARTV
jgi:hypothetical protein